MRERGREREREREGGRGGGETETETWYVVYMLYVYMVCYISIKNNSEKHFNET